jgi:preprotein translocase subunit SecG
MTYFLYTLFFLSCVILIISVLLQPGKTDAGALFTSNVSSNAFGPRGTATVLSKITISAAVVFMLSALLLAMPAVTGDISVLSTITPTTETQPANTNTNANVDANAANANVAVDANAANTNANTNVAAANTNVANTATNAANTNKTNAAANTNKANTAANTNKANANK